MHYLIQKTTRQHIAVADDMPCPVECVKVRADRNGWVVYHDVVCPVPINSRVDICTRDGKVFAGMLAWDVKWSRVSDYRPECDTIMARAGETADDLPPPPTTERRYSSAPRTTAPGHETAAMLLSILCAFALGALIGWGWM